MKKQHGFTLVEIMIVVAIIGLLVAIGIPGFVHARTNARKSTCYNNMRVIAHALQQYALDNGIASDVNCALYDDTIMPATDSRNPDLYIPNYLRCPESNASYGGPVNNTNLNVTCPVLVDDASHGTYGDLE
jgi:prepilin-type N-terminal cleavage/methylation domain-containing protein